MINARLEKSIRDSVNTSSFTPHVDIKKSGNIFILETGNMNESMLNKTIDLIKKSLKKTNIENEIVYEIFNKKIFLGNSIDKADIQKYNEVLTFEKLTFIKEKQEEILAIKKSLLDNLALMKPKDKKELDIVTQEINTGDMEF